MSPSLELFIATLSLPSMRATISLFLLAELALASPLSHGSPSPRGELPPLTSKFNPPPASDPWYRPPEGWESSPPGTVLKIRPHAYPTITIRNVLDTFQLLYRTTDSHLQSTWGVTTVFIPKSHQNCSADASKCARSVVSYQLATDSTWPNAMPSYLLQARDPWGEMRDLLAQGWFVATPDYEGPDAAYCAGKQSGHATLDGIRAVLSVGHNFGLRTDIAKVGLWGYSGGASATQFAVELAATYAPDLTGTIAGAVVGGPTPNMTTVCERMNNKPAAGLVIASLLGITVQNPEMRQFLTSRLKTTGRFNASEFLSTTQMTGLQALKRFYGEDIFQYFDAGRNDAFHPQMQALIDEDAVMGRHGVPNMPVFYHKASNDEMSPASESDALVDMLCGKGATVLYHRNRLGDHNDESWSGRRRTIDFLSSAMEGTKRMEIPAKGTCKTQDVSVPFDAIGLAPDWMFRPLGSDGFPLDEFGKLPVSAAMASPP
jgi:hypothetical protein